MPAIQIGNTTGLLLQPDGYVRQFPDGSGEAGLNYKCNWDLIDTFLPTPLQPHPVFPSLKLYEFNIQREPGDVGIMSQVFRGVLASNPEDLAQYDISISTSSEPVETHPNYAYPPETPPVTVQELAQINQALSTNSNPVGLSTIAQNLYNKMRRGITSYLRVGTVYRKSYCSATRPNDSAFEGVGRIFDPDNGEAPAAPEGQNYILTGFSWRKQAGVYTIGEDALLSGLGGWDLDLYAAPS